MTSILVGIPVLDRPGRVRPVLETLRATAPDARALFLATPGDRAELDELNAVGADVQVVGWPAGPGDFARKHNLAFAGCEAEWYFVGADDLHFHPGWAAAALAAHARDGGACVIGTNDLTNPRVLAGQHATHCLVHRDYRECGTIDEPGLLLHEGYDHQWCDNELVETARWRGTYAHAADALVEHLHPYWGKSPNDATYRRGRAGFDADRARFLARRRLWGATP